MVSLEFLVLRLGRTGEKAVGLVRGRDGALFPLSPRQRDWPVLPGPRVHHPGLAQTWFTPAESGGVGLSGGERIRGAAGECGSGGA